MANVETDVRDIKRYVVEISKKIDMLLDEKELVPTMKLSEKSLSGFFEKEPNIYKVADVKVKYK